MADKENAGEESKRPLIPATPDDFQIDNKLETYNGPSRWQRRQEELRLYEERLKEKIATITATFEYERVKLIQEIAELTKSKDLVLEETAEAQKRLEAEEQRIDEYRDKTYDRGYELKKKEQLLEAEEKRVENEKRLVESDKRRLESYLKKNEHEQHRKAVAAKRWQKRLAEQAESKKERGEAELKYEIKQAEIEQRRRELAERRKQHASEVAKQQANIIRSKFGVEVEILESNTEYRSEKTIARGAQENIFFISLESPYTTRIQTEYIISHLQMRDKTRPIATSLDLQGRNLQLLDLAHAKRTEQANQKSVEFQSIKKKKKKDLTRILGKKPSLNKIADVLNKEKVETPTGDGIWYAQTVKRVLDRNSALLNR